MTARSPSILRTDVMGLHLFRIRHGDTECRKTKEKWGFPSPNALIAACFMLYTAMMSAKGVFLAEIAYLMEVFEVDKATASLTNTYYFVAYAGVQFLLFFIVKKMNLQKFLKVTVPIASIATVLMGLSRGITDMYILFAICGLFQAGIYCGCNATLTTFLPTRYLSRANSVMNLGYATGTVIAYTFSAFFVRFGLWRLPFFVMGAFLLMTVVFFSVCVRGAGKIKMADNAGGTSEVSSKNASDIPFITLENKRSRVIFYAADLILVFLITCLYYAINNWISTMLVEEHGLSQDIAIYITILAPALIAVGPAMTIRYCDRHRDFVRAAYLYLLAALPIPAVLAFFYGSSAILTFVLSVIYIVAVNGVKSIGLSVMAFKLKDVVNTAEYTAISNAIASLAGGIAPTAIGFVIDGFGWKVSYLAVFGVTLGVVIALMGVDIVVRKIDKSKQLLT